MPYTTAVNYSTHAANSDADTFFRAWQSMRPFISYATTRGWFGAADTSSTDTPDPKIQDPPEIDRKEWSDFMDSDNE